MNGMVRIEARLRPDEAAIVLAAIDACAEQGDRADGLVAAAELALGGGERRRKPVEVLLTIDAATFAGRSDTGHGVSPETARRLCCDAGITPVLTEQSGRVLDVGRKTRSIPPALRRALEVRDGGCRFPGCTHTRFVDGHHVRHWCDGGVTALSNIVSLCTRHHRYVHEHGFSVRPTDEPGQFEFRDRHQNVVTTVPVGLPQQPGWLSFVEEDLAAAGVSEHSNEPLQWGEPIDYDEAVMALLPRSAAAGGGPAECDQA